MVQSSVAERRLGYNYKIHVISILSHTITGFKDDSAYVTTKTADRNQRSTEDG